MKDGTKGASHAEAMDGRSAAVAGVVAALSIEERARLSGIYGATCVGPLEHQRDDYVRARDNLMAAEAGVRTLTKIADGERRKARRTGLVRKVVAAVAMALGLAASLTPAMAQVTSDLVQAKAVARTARAHLESFVLEEKWSDLAPNLVTTVGGNLGLDTILAGSAYTTVGPFLFLINTNASAAAIGDTMASHAGWLEVGNANAPAYTAPRKTVAFSAASAKSKAASAASSFAITSGGTVGGCGLVTGTGALSTIDNTAGTLYSAGAFTGGSKVVANGDTLNVTYTATI